MSDENTRLIQAALQDGHVENFARATPREREAGAAVAIVMDDGSAIAQAIAFQAYA